MKHAAALLWVVAFAAANAAAGPDDPHPYDVARDKAVATQADWKKQYAGRDDVLIADGLLADRAKKTVTLLACGTGIGPGESVEFFTTPANSGKDYESLSLTFAKPADVAAALRFIGLAPGRPIDLEANRQWARGPRVIMTLDIAGKTLRAEACVINTDTKKTLPLDGLIFTGSYTYKDDAGNPHLAADASEAKPIAPDFNDPAAVLDVPRRALQGVVYGFQKPAPAMADVKAGDPITITLTPAVGEAAVTERKIAVRIATRPQGLIYAFSEDEKTEHTATDLAHLLTSLAPLIDGKSDWFTTVTVAPDVRVDDVRKLYAVLQAVEKDRGIKLDPPPPGELYYRAFFPDAGWRDRQNRLGEPWELFLDRQAGGTVARLERLIDPENAGPDAKKELQRFPIDSPEAFVKQIAANASQWSKAIFVYPPADMTYGELMNWVRPAMQAYPQVFIFPADAASTRPATQATP